MIAVALISTATVLLITGIVIYTNKIRSAAKPVNKVNAFLSLLCLTLHKKGIKCAYEKLFIPECEIYKIVLPNQAKIGYFLINFTAVFATTLAETKEQEDNWRELYYNGKLEELVASMCAYITTKIKWRFNDKPVEVSKMNSLEITHKWWIVGDFVNSNTREIRLGKYKMLHHAEAALKQHWSKEGALYRDTFLVKNVLIMRSPYAHRYIHDEEAEWIASWHRWQAFLYLHGDPCKLNNGKPS